MGHTGDKDKNEVPEATTFLFPHPQPIREADEGKGGGGGDTWCYKKKLNVPHSLGTTKLE